MIFYLSYARLDKCKENINYFLFICSVLLFSVSRLHRIVSETENIILVSTFWLYCVFGTTLILVNVRRWCHPDMSIAPCPSRLKSYGSANTLQFWQRFLD